MIVLDPGCSGLVASGRGLFTWIEHDLAGHEGPWAGPDRSGRVGPGRAGSGTTAQTGLIHSASWVGVSPAPGHRAFRNPSGSPALTAVSVPPAGWFVGFDPVSGGRGHPGGGIGGRAGVVIPGRPPRQSGSWGAGSRREHPPGRPGYIPRTAEHHNGRAGSRREHPPAARLHPRTAEHHNRPTGRRNDPPPRTVTPCPDADPLRGSPGRTPRTFPARARTPLSVVRAPPMQRSTPSCVPI